jgi:hypothetical protein
LRVGPEDARLRFGDGAHLVDGDLLFGERVLVLPSTVMPR